MIASTENRAMIGKVMSLSFLLATLVAMLLAAPPAGAAALPGKAFSWGLNDYGQLGNGNTGTNSNVPVAVQNLTGVKSVKAGGRHGLALKTDGTESDVPVSVENLTNAKNIDGGLYFSLAVTQ